MKTLARIGALALFALPSAALAQASYPGPDGGWDYVTVDAAHHRVFVARGDGVFVVDTATGKTSTVLDSLKHNHAAVPITDGRELLVTVGATGEAVIGEIATGAIRARIKVGSKPDAAAFDPATGEIFVMDNKGGGVAVIDPVAGTLVGTIAVEGALEFAAVDGAGKLFVNVEDKNELIVIDTRGRSVLAHIPLKGCDGPTGLAYATDSHRIVSACANGVAAVVSAETSSFVGLTPIGQGPDAAVYDPQVKRVYVPSGRDGKLTTVDPAQVKTLEQKPTERGARTAAIDPTTGKVYSATARFQPPVAGEKRPAMAPGSFHVLEIPTR